MSSLPAGWYKDPADPATQRYWDGEGWLGKAIPADATPPEGPPPDEEQPPATPTSAAPAANAHPPAWMPPSPQAPPGWGTQPPGWGAPQQPGWGAQQPGWGTPQPPGSETPQQPGSGAPHPPGSGAPQPYGGAQQPPPPGWPAPPGWGPPSSVPPPGWQPPPGMRAGLYPYPVEARPHGYALAGLGPRLVARLLDILAVLLLNVVVNGYFAYQWAQEFLPIYRATMEQMANGGSAFDVQPSARMDALLWAMLIVATLLWLLYEAPAIASSGQTLGKRIMRIRVVAIENTEPLGFGRAFGRWARLGLWTPAWACAGLGLVLQLIDSISPVFDQQLRQAFHDKTARTVVVALPPGDRQPVDVTSGGGSPGGQPSDHPTHHPRSD